MRNRSRFLPPGIVLLLSVAASVHCAGPSPVSTPQSAPAPSAAPAPGKPASETSTSPEEQKGRALIDRAVEAMGGAKAIDGVRSIDLKGKAKRVFPSGEEVSFAMRTSILFPDRYRQEVELPMVKLVTVLGPDGAYTDMGDGPVLLPEAQRIEFDQSYRRNLLSILRARNAPDFRAVAKTPTEAGDVVEVDASGVVVTLTIDRATGRIARLRFVSVLGPATKENVTEYTDWRKVSGLTYPFATSTMTDGKPANGVVLESVAIDEPLDPELFHPKVAPVPADAPDAQVPGAPPSTPPGAPPAAPPAAPRDASPASPPAAPPTSAPTPRPHGGV